MAFKVGLRTGRVRKNWKEIMFRDGRGYTYES